VKVVRRDGPWKLLERVGGQPTDPRAPGGLPSSAAALTGPRPVAVSEEAMKKIVVGLGNPGSRYEKTRHNIGWLVLDRLADRTGAAGRARSRDAAATVRGRLGPDELILVKPTTYMNLSGVAVRKVLARERAPLAELLVVVDDMDLPFGKLRLRERGSAGGHNGLRSIIGEMGTESFARLRVGIGRPREAAISHVLGDFEHAEQRHLEALLDAAADAVEQWAREGAHRAANRWNAWQLQVEGDAEAAVEGPSSARGSSGSRSGGAPSDGSASGGGRSDGGTSSVPGAPGGRARSGAATVDSSGPGGASGAGPGPSPAGDGIVRTATGWRRLLPGRRRDPGGPT
jgi:peptidyl-tRNA hydrolase, PTH1 family